MSLVVEAPAHVSSPARAADIATHHAAALSGEYLTFSVGNESYGIAIRGVQEIRGYVEPTRISGAPAHVKGMINLRGAIVPIVDLRILFGNPSPAYDPVTATVILDVGSRQVGVVVDSVADVLELHADDIKPPPECASQLGGTHICGIATMSHGDEIRLVVLIDAARLMKDANLPLSATSAA